jgi:endo-1,4-beta-xylanase
VLSLLLNVLLLLAVPGVAFPSAPAIHVALRGSEIPVGSEFTGIVSLDGDLPKTERISILSSNPAVIGLDRSTITVLKGTKSAFFHYRGGKRGQATISAHSKESGSASVTITATESTTPTSLRSAAKSRGLLIGAAALAGELGYPDPLKSEPLYSETLGSQFDMLEPETAMKWIALRPSSSTYDFSASDELVNFAVAHNMQVRGHTLVWCVANPQWLDAYINAPPAQVATLLHDHIQTVVSRYKGKVFAWDVVNEALDENSSGSDLRLQHCLWYDRPGIGQDGIRAIEQAFLWAHEADPGALLFYNENDILSDNRKFEALCAMLTDFVRRRVPISGVGLQMHLGINGYPDSSVLARNIRRITDLGLQVHITELDVALPVDASGQPTEEDRLKQAATYRRITNLCLENPGCTALQMWGLTDKHSWVPASHPGQGAALPFDREYRAKPAAKEILNLLYKGNRQN